jgi:hypothetical protein
MSELRLTRYDDPVVVYRLEADRQRIGEVRWHAAHAAVLRIGEAAWWLADDVAAASHGSSASVARRVLAHLSQPRSYSLRADGGEAVLARATRRWRWSTRENGLDCEIGGEAWQLRVAAAFGGRFSLADAGGARRGELAIAGLLGGGVSARDLPLPLPEAAFLLYATHRMFGQDPHSTVGYA